MLGEISVFGSRINKIKSQWLYSVIL